MIPQTERCEWRFWFLSRCPSMLPPGEGENDAQHHLDSLRKRPEIQWVTILKKETEVIHSY